MCLVLERMLDIFNVRELKYEYLRDRFISNDAAVSDRPQLRVLQKNAP